VRVTNGCLRRPLDKKLHIEVIAQRDYAYAFIFTQRQEGFVAGNDNSSIARNSAFQDAIIWIVLHHAKALPRFNGEA